MIGAVAMPVIFAAQQAVRFGAIDRLWLLVEIKIGVVGEIHDCVCICCRLEIND